MQLADPTAPVPPNGAQPAPAPFAAGAPLGAPGAFAAPRRDYEAFDLPESIPVRTRSLSLKGERYVLVGVTLVLLTPEEDKRAAARAGGNAENGIILATLKAVEAMRFLRVAPLAESLDKDGNRVEAYNAAQAFELTTSTADGSAEAAWAAMHPAIREAITLAYASSSSIGMDAAALFVASRRPVSR